MPDATDVRDQVSMPDLLELLGEDMPSKLPGHINCLRHDEATPSLYVENDHWYAFCCGVGGDAIDFLRSMKGLSFGQAVNYLAGTLDDFNPRPKVEREAREVKDFTGLYDAAEDFKVGSEPFSHALAFFGKKWPHLSVEWVQFRFEVKVTRHALWIPHRDHEGVVRGIKTRSLHSGDKKAVKGSTFGHRLYRSNRPRVESDVRALSTALLVEGESDTWSFDYLTEAKGYFNADVFGLPSGVRTWRDTYLEELRPYGRVQVWTDDDRAGNAGAETVIACFPQGVAERQRVPRDYKDVSEAVADGWAPW